MSCVRAHSFATLWTVAQQAPLSMGFFQARILEWLSFLTPGDLPNPEMEPASLVSPALVGGFFTTAPPEYVKSLSNCLQE